MAEAIFQPPQGLDLTDANLAENFKRWKRQIDVYLIASGATTKPKITQTAIILHCGGPQVLEIFDHFVFESPEDKDDPQKVLKKIEEYCIPKHSEVIETFRFWNIVYQDPFDKFLTELRSKASSCNFQDKDRMLRDKIVFSTRGKLQELLLHEKDLSLSKAIDICRVFEVTSKRAQEMSNTETHKIERVSTNKSKTEHSKPIEHMKPVTENKQPIDCHFCGKTHERNKYKCPAWGKLCHNCNGRNHFKEKCKKVRTVTEDVSDEEEKWLAAIKGGDRATAEMVVNNCCVIFQLDTGADVNTISTKFVKREQVRPTKKKLIMWNNTKLQPVGEAILKLSNPKNGEVYDIKFTVVDNNFSCLLGLKTLQSMGLVTIHEDNFIGQVKSATENSLGDLGEASLQVDPNTTPKVLPCRRLPIALKNEVKQEINRLVERGVLIPVEEPTVWVSQMAVARKGNGNLRICIDPQPLNEALMREHFKLPTLEDLLPTLKNAKIFSKLDVQDAYWHVRLDDASSKLTTMITPFGRYRWARLPFGLKVSSEIFQKRLNVALGDLEGTFCIADDIIVVGCGETDTIAGKDHDLKLNNLQDKCSSRSIKLNNEKAVLKQSQITFMGHRIGSKGLQVDNSKVQAIIDMPAPSDIHAVKRFCGMVQYMAKFLPNLAGDLEPIRALTRKGEEWQWTPMCEDAYEKIKHKLTNTPILAYFDDSKELILQADSSKDGLGAALLQDGRPLEYASRALTHSERNWAQIEKELLAVVYGLERFDQYTYGRKVLVQNDHKPLASILRKPLSQAPKRLQTLILRLHRYDVEFKYLEGSKLVIADTLSRAYLASGDYDVRVMNVNVFEGLPDKRVEEVQQATQSDESLQVLLRFIKLGWPENKYEIPTEIRVYYDLRDTLSHHEGVILKGERLVIPKSLRADMKKRLHAAHTGYDSMMRRAREAIFWPGMSKDIKQMADDCEICLQAKPRNQKETLLQHDDGQSPWDKVAIDLFDIKDRSYLVSIDYYSNFIEADYLTTTTSSQVITKLKGHFARYGIPKELVSDCGPQLTSIEFKRFTEKWGIKHTTSSPYHHQANGKAEAAVKIIKGMMKKALLDNTDQYHALLELRNTPRQDTGLSPSQMMFGRHTRTMVPTIGNRRKEVSKENLDKRAMRKSTVKKHYDKKAHDLHTLSPNQSVFYQPNEGREWKKAQVLDQHSERSYIIQGEDGGVYRRNRVHIRPTGSASSDKPSQQNMSVEPEVPEVQTSEQVEETDPTKDLSTTETPTRRSSRSKQPPVWQKDYVKQ